MANVTSGATIQGCVPGIPNCYEGINISAFSCDKEKLGHIHELSRYCYFATDVDSTQCFPTKFFTDEPTDYNIQLFATLWMLFVGTIGVVGNSLTILAIPYNMAIKRLENNILDHLIKLFGHEIFNQVKVM